MWTVQQITPEVVKMAQTIKLERGGDPNKISAYQLRTRDKHRNLVVDAINRLRNEQEDEASLTLRETVDTIKSGDELSFRFRKKSATSRMAYVISLFHGDIIAINEGQLAIAMAIWESENWDGDQNKTVEATAGPNWDAGQFWVRIGRWCDSIRVLN
jgi:hypothetical protein